MVVGSLKVGLGLGMPDRVGHDDSGGDSSTRYARSE